MTTNACRKFSSQFTMPKLKGVSAFHKVSASDVFRCAESLARAGAPKLRQQFLVFGMFLFGAPKNSKLAISRFVKKTAHHCPLPRQVELHAGGPFLVRTARTITVLYFCTFTKKCHTTFLHVTHYTVVEDFLEQ